MTGVSPVAAGLSARRWANVRSLAAKALEELRPVLPQRHTHALMPEWETLVASVEPQQKRYALLAGLRWLSGRGVAPGAVTQEDLDGFRRALVETSLRARPHEVWSGFVRAWNAARTSIPGWPAVTLEKPGRRTVVTLPWGAFPPSLRSDAEAWLARQAGHDITDEDGPPRPLRPSSIESYRYLIRSVASSAVAEGIDPASLTSLADLVCLPVFKAALRGQWKRTGSRPSATLSKIASVLISIGTFWVKLPQSDLARLRDAGARRSPRKEKRSRMVSAADLLGLGLRLMATAPEAGTARQQALAYRDGLIIALFALQPLRRANLVSLEIGRTLVEVSGLWRIAIPGSETKSGQPVEVPWPEELHDHLRRYLDVQRPVLAQCRGRCRSAVGQALWVSAHGSPLSQEQVYHLVMKRTQAAFGIPINPHLARDIAATTLAIADPTHVRAAAPLLGHTSLATTERHYQQAQGLDAQRRYYRELVDLRQSAREEPPEAQD